MRKPPRHLDKETKLAAVARMESGENVTALAQELGVERRSLYRWRAVVRRAGRARLGGRRGRPRKGSWAASRPLMNVGPEAGLEVELKAAKEEIAALERKIGRQQLELDFFRKALRRIKGEPQTSSASGEATSTRSSKP